MIATSVDLKPKARVAKLVIQDGAAQQKLQFPLLGETYVIGRDRHACNVLLRNPLVSQVHCLLRRDPRNPRQFHLIDQQSTNGIYIGGRRCQRHQLRPGDTFTLGPPDINHAVTIRYEYAPPFWIWGLRQLCLLSTGGLTLLVILFGWLWSNVPVRPLPQNDSGPVIVFSRDGQTALNPEHQQTHRELSRLEDFSTYLPAALLASEDSRFYWHFGIDPIGIARAIQINLQNRQLQQGASTLTQQLARSLFTEVGRQNTPQRKLREMAVALKLEAVYSKHEILKTYLNRVYLGAGNYGFEDAAQFYFDKSAVDLSLSEAATLVAALPAPNRWNPVQDYDTSLQLRNRVIERMAQQGRISAVEADRARRSRIEISPKAKQTFSNTLAPYFYSYVLEELKDILGESLAQEGNFFVLTELDLNWQKQAERALAKNIQSQGQSLPYSQGAIVTLASDTGAIRALVGGVNYGQSQFNRATQAQRQPGSTFKLFTYGAAFANDILPQRTYSCEALTWQAVSYQPCERSEAEEVSLYQGLVQSENVIALRLAQEVGLGKVAELAQQLGVRSPLKLAPGLVIGQSEVTLLEMTGAYGAIANRGRWNRPHAIQRVLDGTDCKNSKNYSTCREIYAYPPDRHPRQVLTPHVADTLTRLLQGVIREGTGRTAYLGRDEAGKTGTTDQGKDLWFMGYLPSQQLITGVWLGNDDASPTNGSSAQAASLWQSYMAAIIR